MCRLTSFFCQELGYDYYGNMQMYEEKDRAHIEMDFSSTQKLNDKDRINSAILSQISVDSAFLGQKAGASAGVEQADFIGFANYNRSDRINQGSEPDILSLC